MAWVRRGFAAAFVLLALRLGPVTYEEPRRDPLGQSLGPRRAYADTTAERIDAAVRARLPIGGALRS